MFEHDSHNFERLKNGFNSHSAGVKLGALS
jgi:hypothetical protein